MIYDGEDAGDRLDSRNVDKIRREDTTVLFWNLTGLRSSTQDLQKLNKKHKVNMNILLETKSIRDIKNKFDFEVNQRAFKKKIGKGTSSGGIYLGSDTPI